METSFILLDGGMGRELQERGLIPIKSIWSAMALIDHPDIVRDIHEAFIVAGADVITTNTYGVVRGLLAEEGMEDRLAEMIGLGTDVARQARERQDRPVRIAGSLPPLGISYRPELVLPDHALREQYEELIGLLAPQVDILLGETFSTAREGRAAAEAACGAGVPLWIAWSLAESADGRLRSGETIEEAVAAVADLPVEALLFNCCSVEAVSTALPRLRRATDHRIGAYANTFVPLPEDYVMGEGAGEAGGHPLRDDMRDENYLAFAQDWRRMGADIVGGCCGIGPGTITLLRQNLT